MADRTKRKRVVWEKIEISESEVQNNWRKKDTSSFNYGNCITYYCAFGGKKCSANLRVKMYNDGTVIYTTNKMEHNNHRKEQYGLTVEQKKVVEKLCNANIDRPTDVIEILKVKNLCAPQTKKLNNFLSYYRRKNLIFSNNIGEVVTWCKTNSKVPLEEDTAFVIKYDIQENHSDEPDLRVFISTKRLLSIAPYFSHVNADATYKLNKQGYPILIVGTTDKEKKFHPFGLAISKKEEFKDYKFLFESLKCGVESVCGIEYKPKYLVADCAEAITNGFKSVFGEEISRVYCYFHVKKAYENRLRTISNRTLREKISEDIVHLHHSSSPDMFKAASILWCDKWSDTGDLQVIAFVNYFMKNWVHKSANWYLGYVSGQHIPITNNALESCNKYIKQIYTKRRMRALGELTSTAAYMIANWSEIRCPNAVNKKTVTWTTDISIKTIRLAYSWKQENPSIAFQRLDVDSFVGCFAIDGTRIRPCDKNSLLSSDRYARWTCFSDYVKSEIKYTRVSGKYSEHFSNYKCTCVMYLKTYFCKHIVVFAYLNGTFKFPPEAITGGMGQKAKRGRPKKISRALCKG